MQRMEMDIAVRINFDQNDQPVDPDISPTPLAQEPNDDLNELVTFLRGDGPYYDLDLDLDVSLDGQWSLQL